MHFAKVNYSVYLQRIKTNKRIPNPCHIFIYAYLLCITLYRQDCHHQYLRTLYSFRKHELDGSTKAMSYAKQ